MPDFPSMVLALVAALLVVRSLDEVRPADAVMAGLVAGAAGGLKPANYLFVVGAVLAYLVARQWRGGALFLVALVPSVLVLAYWKDKGLGYLPAVSPAEVRLAATVGVSVDLDRYVDLDFDHWRQQMNYLREFFWSARVAQWAPVAGLLAVLRMRRAPIAALLAGWLGAFLIVKGFSPRADIEANTFWRLLMPAWPAYLLLFASIPMLVPTLAARLGRRVEPPVPGSPVPRRWIIVVAVAALAVPALATAAATQLEPPSPPALVQDPGGATILTPIDESIEVTARRTDDGVVLDWTDDGWRAGVFYRVYRTAGTDGDTLCVTEEDVSWRCYLKADTTSTTRQRTFVDSAPLAEATYRIGVGTNWADDPEQGDVFALSPEVVVRR